MAISFWHRNPGIGYGATSVSNRPAAIQFTQTDVAVEKLIPVKFAKIKSRQDALQTTFSVFLDIFCPPNFGDFEENGVFQHPQLVSA
jgi:hypothetical protein